MHAYTSKLPVKEQQAIERHTGGQRKQKASQNEDCFCDNKNLLDGGEKNMKKFTKRMVAVAASAVITVVAAGMAFGANYTRKCPVCGGDIEISYGTLKMWTERQTCIHGYADRGVMDTVNYRQPVYRHDCVDCDWYEDYIMGGKEEMSRICGVCRGADENE